MVRKNVVDEIVNDLQILLAETYGLYLKTQLYHWNVTGNNFYSLHLLFESQYKDLADAVDVIAERIRALGKKVSASLSLFGSSKELPDPVVDADSQLMLRDLIKSHDHMVKLLLNIAEISSAANDKATEDIVIERLREHEKQLWILKSSL